MKKFLSSVFDQLTRYNEMVNTYNSATAAAPDHAMAYVNWGIKLANEGDYGGAIEKFTQASEMAPDRDEPFSNWGIALAKQGKLTEALSQFKKAVALAPENINNYLLWGAALVESGDAEAAEAHYKRAIQITPQNPEPYVNWGIALTRSGQYEEAIKRFKQALIVKRYQPRVYFLWGAVLAELGRFEEAAEKFQVTTRYEPNHGEAHYFLSVCHNRLGNYDSAIEASRSAIQYLADNPELYLNLGDSLANQGRYDVAIANYEQALKLSPDLAEAYKSWGDALFQQKLYPEAEEKYQKAKDVNSELLGLYKAWGHCKIQQNQYAEALPILEKAHQLNPDDHQTSVQWGLALIKTGQPQQALDKLFAVEAEDSWNPRVHYLLGTHYLSENKASKAITHFEKALQYSPDFEDAAINLALAYSNQRQYEEAIRTLRPLLRKSPDSAKVNFFYGNIQLQSGDEIEGIKKLEKAIKLQPDYTEPYLLLAETALKNNQPQQALTTLETAQSSGFANPVLFLLQAVAFLKTAIVPSGSNAVVKASLSQNSEKARIAIDKARANYGKQGSSSIPQECRYIEAVVYGLLNGLEALNHRFENLTDYSNSESTAETKAEATAQRLFYQAQGAALLDDLDYSKKLITEARALDANVFKAVNPALILVDLTEFS